MSKLSDEDIRHLAALARISVTDEEVVKFRDQLSGILDYVKQLDDVDTKGLEPTSQITGLTNVQRSDNDVTDTMDRNDLLDQTPNVHDGQIKSEKSALNGSIQAVG